MERSFPRIEINATGEVITPQEKFRRLQEAVKQLYNAAYWSPDRDVDSAQLWEAVRDAAGIPPGNSPQSINNSNATLITETENGR